MNELEKFHRAHRRMAMFLLAYGVFALGGFIALYFLEGEMFHTAVWFYLIGFVAFMVAGSQMRHWA